MQFGPLLLIELLFSGVILAWAGYELWSVRKSKRSLPKDTSSLPPDEPRHPEG
jgi:hypothetical protein